MVVDATYVLCTTSPHWILDREAHHFDKVTLNSYAEPIRMIPVCSATTVLPPAKPKS